MKDREVNISKVVEDVCEGEREKTVSMCVRVYFIYCMDFRVNSLRLDSWSPVIESKTGFLLHQLGHGFISIGSSCPGIVFSLS